MLADDALLDPRQADALHAEAEAVLRRHAQAAREGAVPGLLAIRRRELFRTAAADLLGKLDSDLVAEAVGTVTTVTIAGALELAGAAVAGSAGAVGDRLGGLGPFAGAGRG